MQLITLGLHTPPSPEKKQFPWGRATLAALTLAAVGGAAAIDHFVVHSEELHFPKEVPVVFTGDKVLQVPIVRAFDHPRDMRTSEIDVELKVPQAWEEKQVAVLGMESEDTHGHRQATRWTEGQITRENVNYDARHHTLGIHYRPSTVEVNEQGRTDEGFDPSSIMGVRLLISSEASKSAPITLLQVEKSKLLTNEPLQAPADVRPLLRSQASTEHTPLSPTQQTAGVSRFFNYGDLHHWDGVRADVDKALAAQDAQGFHAFRFMGGLDLRHQAGNSQIDPAVFPAMRDFLNLCNQHHQDHVVFSLLDGAVANPTLQKAFNNPSQRKQLIEALRPFVREFGNAKVNGQPVIFDLVNEIDGAQGTELAKQQLVHDMVDLFVAEAPGAKLTVGVQNFRDLKYWTHLPDRYAGKPVEFMMSFHLYEDVNNLPKASQLNLPAHTEVAITEADPNKNMGDIIHKTAADGYDWMLFWTDGAHPYQPSHHRQVIH